MAEYGVMIDNVNGNPFVTPVSTPFCLYRKLTANSVRNGAYHSASVSVTLDARYPCIVFCKTSLTQSSTVVGSGRVGNTVTASSSNAAAQGHTLTAYIFAIFPQTLPDWGLAVWDAQGTLVLTNESRVLSDLVTVGTPGNNGGINIDQTLSGSYAVAPICLGSSLWQTTGGAGGIVIINVTAFAAAGYNGSTTRINAAASTQAQGSPAGGTNTGVAIVAINTANYD